MELREKLRSHLLARFWISCVSWVSCATDWIYGQGTGEKCEPFQRGLSDNKGAVQLINGQAITFLITKQFIDFRRTDYEVTRSLL
jgi:hypothetical protein